MAHWRLLSVKLAAGPAAWCSVVIMVVVIIVTDFRGNETAGQQGSSQLAEWAVAP
ncbi:hypothetical protein VTH06DRAFT_8126 [Thermothelomyces fergusii]